MRLRDEQVAEILRRLTSKLHSDQQAIVSRYFLARIYSIASGSSDEIARLFSAPTHGGADTSPVLELERLAEALVDPTRIGCQTEGPSSQAPVWALVASETVYKVTGARSGAVRLGDVERRIAVVSSSSASVRTIRR